MMSWTQVKAPGKSFHTGWASKAPRHGQAPYPPQPKPLAERLPDAGAPEPKLAADSRAAA